MIRQSWKFRYGWLTAVVLVVAAVAVTVQPPVASADEIASDVFSMQNLTPYPLVVLGSQTKLADGGSPWASSWGNSFPYPGQVIQPGQTEYYDNARYYNGIAGNVVPNEAWIEFSVGYGGPKITYHMYNNGKGNGTAFHEDRADCSSADKAWHCDASVVQGTGGDYGGKADVESATQQTSTVAADTKAPAAAGTDLPWQLYLLQSLCKSGSDWALSCEIEGTASSDTKYQMHLSAVGSILYDYIPAADFSSEETEREGTHSVGAGWEVGTSYEVGGSFAPLALDLLEAIKVKVAATFKHEWGTTKALDIENSVFVKPGFYGYITADVTADELTGTWKVTVGNDTYIIQNATLTNPVDTTVGNQQGFDWSHTAQSYQMNSCQLANGPPTPPQVSDIPPDTAPDTGPANQNSLGVCKATTTPITTTP
jgi:hypothetical protein